MATFQLINSDKFVKSINAIGKTRHILELIENTSFTLALKMLVYRSCYNTDRVSLSVPFTNEKDLERVLGLINTDLATFHYAVEKDGAIRYVIIERIMKMLSKHTIPFFSSYELSMIVSIMYLMMDGFKPPYKLFTHEPHERDVLPISDRCRFINARLTLDAHVQPYTLIQELIDAIIVDAFHRINWKDKTDSELLVINNVVFMLGLYLILCMLRKNTILNSEVSNIIMPEYIEPTGKMLDTQLTNCLNLIIN